MESALRGAASGETPLEASRRRGRLRGLEVCVRWGGKGGRAYSGVFLREEQGRIGVALPGKGSCANTSTRVLVRLQLTPAVVSVPPCCARGAPGRGSVLCVLSRPTAEGRGAEIEYKRAPTLKHNEIFIGLKSN